MDCIFCKIIKGEIPSKVIYEDDLVMVMMDINPVSDGHVLVLPKKHYTDFLELDNDISNHIFKVAKDLGPRLMQKLKAKALTLIVNYGDSQQVKHFHLHLIPDYLGSKVKDNLTDLDQVYNIIKN